MSISYCEKHDISHDEDYQLECPRCEAESIEREALHDEAKEDPNSLESLIKSTGWSYKINNQ
jgi:hypothetical protein